MLACVLAAAKGRTLMSHVEAGLRSFIGLCQKKGIERTPARIVTGVRLR